MTRRLTKAQVTAPDVLARATAAVVAVGRDDTRAVLRAAPQEPLACAICGSETACGPHPAAPQEPLRQPPGLSDRVRPDVEAAPWVVAAIRQLEADLRAAEERHATLDLKWAAASQFIRDVIEALALPQPEPEAIVDLPSLAWQVVGQIERHKTEAEQAEERATKAAERAFEYAERLEARWHRLAKVRKRAEAAEERNRQLEVERDKLQANLCRLLEVT